jgi:hypothetical protein
MSDEDMPTKNSDVWGIVKNLPTGVQIVIMIIFFSSFVNVPAGLTSLLNTGPTVDAIKIQNEAIKIAHDTIRERSARIERADHFRNIRIDSLYAGFYRMSDQVDFLWCMNERTPTPEVRQLCIEIREAAKLAQQRRALEPR